MQKSDSPYQPVSLTERPGQPELKGMALPAFTDFDPWNFPWERPVRVEKMPDGIGLAKVSRSRTVLSFEKDDKVHFIKQICPWRLKNRVSALLTGSKAEREFEAASEFLARGFAVPLPVFYVSNKSNSISYLVTEGLTENLQPLSQYLKHHDMTDELIERIARFTALLHQEKLYHHDYRSDHLWLAKNWPDQSLIDSFTLIDLDGANWGRSPSSAQRREAMEELFLSLLRVDFSETQADLFISVYNNECETYFTASEIYQRAMKLFRKNH